MNPLNYASLEASKRLVDAGIVLETEAVWRKKRDKTGYYLSRKALYHRTSDIPAPCMAEVWRELPGEISYYTLDVTKIGQDTQATYSKIDIFDCYVTKGNGGNTNPTDALIDLLIWQRKEANHVRSGLPAGGGLD